MWIFTHKWFIIITKAFNIKYLILKSFIRQKGSGNSASSRPDSHFSKPDQELSVASFIPPSQECLVCVNIAINVQRAKRHLSILLFGHSQLWFHSFTPPSSLVSVQFDESGSLLFRRDYQTSFSCPPTDPLNSMMPRFGSAWLEPKELLYIPGHVLLYKQLQNWLCTALEATWATAKLLEEFSLQHFCADSVGNGKIPEDAEPQHSSGCSTANPGTATPVYDKAPKQ